MDSHIFIALSAFNNLPGRSQGKAYLMMSVTTNCQAKNNIFILQTQNSFSQGLNNLFEGHPLALIWGLNFPQVLNGCSECSNSTGLLEGQIIIIIIILVRFSIKISTR